MGRDKVPYGVQDRVYADWVLTGSRQEDIAKKYKISTNSVHNILNKKLKSNQHKDKVREIRKMNSEKDNEYYTELVSKEVELVPTFEGVPIYKTVGAWGAFEKKQHRILKYIKKF